MTLFKTYALTHNAITRLNFLRNQINRSPSYQRNSDIWDLEKRQLLIDSILNSFDIGKIYFHLLNKPKKLKSGGEIFYSIIDGKQRIETILGFLDNKFPLAKDFKYYENPNLKLAGLYYNDISKKYPELKSLFDSYGLPIIIVETNDYYLIEEMFSRLNEAVPLSSAEKRNAFGGPMVTVINDLCLHPFFTENINVTNKRYQHKEIAVRLLYLEKTISKEGKIIDTKKNYLDDFVKSYNKQGNIDDSIELKEKVTTIINEMNRTFRKKDALLRSQANIPIYYLLYKYAMEQNKLLNITINKLNNFRDEIVYNKSLAEENISNANFDLLQYDRLTIQGTNDASSIKERIRIITTYFNITPPQFDKLPSAIP